MGQAASSEKYPVLPLPEMSVPKWALWETGSPRASIRGSYWRQCVCLLLSDALAGLPQAPANPVLHSEIDKPQFLN